MAQTLANADAALKEDYQPAIREQLNTAFMLLTQIEKNSRDIEGRRAILSLHTGRNEGVGARQEMQDLPTAGQQGYTEERVPLRYNYGRIQISEQVIRASRSDSGSYVRQLDAESKGIVNDLKMDVNRQLWNYTSDGALVKCGVTTASTTVVLDAAATRQQLASLRPGQLVDVGTVAQVGAQSGARVLGASIVSVNRVAKTLVLSSAITTAATDFIFRAGAGGSGSNQRELTSVPTIVQDSGTLFNVDPTTVPDWKAYVNRGATGTGDSDGTNRNLTDALAATLIDEVGIAAGQPAGSLFVAPHGVGRTFAGTLTSIKRFNDTVDLKGGWKGLSVSSVSGEATLVADKDAPAETAFLLSTPNLTQFEMSDWEFMDEDGAVLSRVPNKHAYEAVLFKFHELATDKRNAHGRLNDLTET